MHLLDLEARSLGGITYRIGRGPLVEQEARVALGHEDRAQVADPCAVAAALVGRLAGPVGQALDAAPAVRRAGELDGVVADGVDPSTLGGGRPPFNCGNPQTFSRRASSVRDRKPSLA